jgi:tRNA dimethylallyltransferase
MRVICIVGPTAAGKTAAAVRIASAIGAEILSCDSVAVYRGLDIGAAKPTAEERARVRHHLIDVADPIERFSAARWAELADRAAKDIAARGLPIVVAGGTGLYLRAFLRGLVPTPPPDPEIRARHQSLALEALRESLLRVDPESAARIAPGDRVRLSRALEVWEQTGVKLSELQRRHRLERGAEAPRPDGQSSSRAHPPLGAPRYQAAIYGIEPPRAELHARIQARVEAMMAAGLLEEVRALREQWGESAHALGSLGYLQLLAHLRGETTLEEAVRRIGRDTRRFARRQLTWFRSEPGVLWYASGSEIPEHGDRNG